MKIHIQSESNIVKCSHVIYVATKKQILNLSLSEQEIAFVQQEVEKENFLIEINQYTNKAFVLIVEDKEYDFLDYEKIRKNGHQIHALLQKSKIEKVNLQALVTQKDLLLVLLEGISLTNYQFIKYFTDQDKKKNSLVELGVCGNIISENDLEQLRALLEGVKFARDLVNEPLSYLNAEKLSEEIREKSLTSGYSVEVFGKKKIQSLKMGGLLAVNQGSIDDPNFSILEWKPENAKNKKPVVFVGKGIVYDTGGLSLKPTPGSMDLMKSDMGGAAAVAGAIYAIAKAKLPVHVIGLIPATDNRPSGNAYAPGDVVEMYNGSTVEVLNTDAEGRMILADALSYAEKYEPEFVADLATLTGAAAFAIGKYGVVAMGNKESQDKMQALKNAGNMVYERIAEFPFWDEYDELLKSDIADLKNIGGRVGGAITAGKFLEHFTNYPWIHLDIAGPAFVESQDNYRGKGGTGVGVRLLFEFIKEYQS
jgi:leucyl aminopeptidase